MKTKLFQVLLSALFCLILGGTLLLFLLLPKEDFSQNEKRVLSAAPDLSWRSLRSGDFADQAEEYAADHLPGRDLLVGLNAAYDLVSGRQVTKEVYLGRDGRLLEAPVSCDMETLKRNMETVKAFAQGAERPVDLLLIPSAGCVLPEELPALADPYPDRELIAAACGLAGEDLQVVDLLPAFDSCADRPALYYRTDHHWTSRGAWLAAGEYLAAKGRPSLPETAYTKSVTPDFRGSTYSRAALWGLPGEELELWDSGGSFTVENAESGESHEGLFYTQHLAEGDKYQVFLDGNHSLVRLRDLTGEGKGRLLLVRDSFASCLACFLADAYEEIVLVDLRYYKSPVSELLEEGFDDILIAYSVGNFMTDSNIVRLE